MGTKESHILTSTSEVGIVIFMIKVGKLRLRGLDNCPRNGASRRQWRFELSSF